MLRTLFLAGLLLVSSTFAQAYTVVYEPGDSNVVNRINDLVISLTGFSGTYDVIFSLDNFSTVQAAGGYPIYDQKLGSTIANGVVSEIIAALNTTTASKVGSTSEGIPQGTFFLPYDDASITNALGSRGRYIGLSGPWTDDGGIGVSFSKADNTGFVTVSLVPVPLPAALPLLLGGLCGLGLLARQRRTITWKQ
jgi:hypothetical protein